MTVAVGSAPARRRVFHGVQLLRFVAALSVVASHVATVVRSRSALELPDVPTGQLGVATFFTISGFVAVLVTGGDRRPHWGDFLRRRLVRIVPLAWAAMTLKLVVSLLAPGLLDRPPTSVAYVLLSYAFLPARGADGLVQPLHTVAWTLSFELLFYAVVTVGLAFRVDPLRFVAPVLAVLALASIPRALLHDAQGWPSWAFYADPIVLCFALGMIVARCTVHGDHWRAARQLAAVLALWGAVAAVVGSSPRVVVLAPAACLLLVVTVASERVLRRLVGRRLLTLGDASYALYLTHPFVLPVVVLAITAVGSPGGPWSVALIATVGSVVVSVVVWHLVDRPSLRLLLRATAPATTRPGARAPD